MTNPFQGKAFKRNIWKFISGRILSALLTFCILLLLVRGLTIEAYAGYVAFIALLEIGFGLSQLGLTWLAARYLPEYLLNASGTTLTRQCGQIALVQVMSVLIFAGLGWLMFDSYLSWLGLQEYSAAAQWLVLLFMLEALGRFSREALLGSLMLQGESRLSMVCRQALFLTGVILLMDHGVLSLQSVIQLEVVASLFSLLVAIGGLGLFLFKHRQYPGDSSWSGAAIMSHWRLAFKMYLSHLLALLSGPQVMVSLLQRYAGPEATALFGFIKSISEQLARYLPATLMLSIIRPKLVATFLAEGPEALRRMSGMAGKVSLLVLLPLIAIAFGVGDQLISLLSGGKFPDGHWVLLAYLLLLIPVSQRQLMETVVVTLEKPDLCRRAGVVALVSLPAAWLLLDAGAGIWAPIISLGLNYLFYNLVLLVGLRKQFRFPILSSSHWKLFIGFIFASIAALLVGQFEVVQHFQMADSLIDVALTLSCFLIVVAMLNPFTQFERQKINTFTKRRIFVL